ncbi:glycosyltransferase family 4 protein [Legionella sainthelensi]|uniref:Glycosyltransferase family 1 protein n=1 Tax=Legionella sainthelensi TaxID=28087 RepID=A0A2H5FHL2_9GAMM|nr:glycosyltransferase family 1 protein [Legionella sainthelensi]AUH71044.1 glycosyltransferase family 1 protein [Legionella sainthelensi]
MKLILDITRMLGTLVTGRYSGIGVDRVLLAYIQNYRGNSQAFIKFGAVNCVYSQKTSTALFDYLLEVVEGNQTLKQSIITKFLMCKRNNQDISNSIYLHIDQEPYNSTLFKQLNIPIVYMVHDLIPLYYAEYSVPKYINKHAHFIENCIHHGAGIITNSQSTLNELRAYHKGAQKRFFHSLAAPLASGLSLQTPPESRIIPEPYFVVLSTIEGRKNHLLLLHIWRYFVERLASATPKLVLIGKRGWRCGQVLDLLDHCKQIKPFIVEEPSCSDQKLITYIHHAQALLFPTFTEGYGLPLIEALSNGTPVIASDIPVFREIAGDIPEYIHPLDTLKWMEMIEAYSKQDNFMRVSQLERIKSFKIPTWNDHFQKVNPFLQKISETYHRAPLI